MSASPPPPPGSSTDPSDTEPRDGTTGRNGWILPAVVTAVLILVIGLVLIFSRGQAHQPPVASPASAGETTQPTTALSANEPTPTQNTPSATATPPTAAVELPVSGGSYNGPAGAWIHPHVWVETPSADLTCQVLDQVPVPAVLDQVPFSELVDQVYCMASFSVPPTLTDGQQAVGATINADGEFDWVDWGMAPKKLIPVEYGNTYRALGWTIEPTPEGTTFTNDKTGHGMLISVKGAEPF